MPPCEEYFWLAAGPGTRSGEDGAAWALGLDEHALLSGKKGAKRLDFAVLVRFFARRGRFPQPEEIGAGAAGRVACHVGVDAGECAVSRPGKKVDRPSDYGKPEVIRVPARATPGLGPRRYVESRFEADEALRIHYKH